MEIRWLSGTKFWKIFSEASHYSFLGENLKNIDNVCEVGNSFIFDFIGAIRLKICDYA